MKDTFRIKLEQLSRRPVGVATLLSDPLVTNDMNRFHALPRQRSSFLASASATADPAPPQTYAKPHSLHPRVQGDAKNLVRALARFV